MKSYMKLFSLALGLFSTTLYGMSASLLDKHFIEEMKRDIPAIAQSGSVGLANLNLNRQGNVIAVYPGEKIFGVVNIACDADQIDPHAVYQIVVGYEALGAEKCIFNDWGYSFDKNGIISFFVEAPKIAGVYDIQFRLEQARSPLEAMQSWGSEDSIQMTIGKVIVLE